MEKRRFFVSLCLLQFAGNFANSLQGVLLSSYIEEYGLQSTTQGMMGTFASVGCFFSAFLVLLLAGKIKRQHFVIFSGVFMSAALLFISSKPQFIVFLILHFLIGVGYASNSNLCSSLVNSLTGNSGKAMGILHAAFGLGGLLAPIILNACLESISWNFAAFVDGIVVAAIYINYVFTLKASRNITATLAEKRENITSEDVKKYFSNKKNAFLLLGTFGYQGFQYGIAVWIARYSDMNLSVAGYGALILSSFWIGTAAARIIVPNIKLPTETLFSFGCFVSAATLLLGVAAGQTWLMFICIILSGFASGASVPQTYQLGAVWNEGRSLLSGSTSSLVMYSAQAITAPITAYCATDDITGGLTAIIIYALIGGFAMLPPALRELKGQKRRAEC